MELFSTFCTLLHMNGIKFRELREGKKLSYRELADILEVDWSLIGKWEKMNYMPQKITFLKICDFFKVDPNYLLDIEPKPTDSNVEFVKPSPTVSIPVFGNIPAGKPIEACEDIMSHIEIPEGWTKNGQDYFGLLVKGDSMLPEFKEGDTIVLKQQTCCDSGQFAAVSINKTEVTLKKVRRQASGITLQPLNPNYEPVFFTNKEIKELPVTILGVVVEVRRSFK